MSEFRTDRNNNPTAFTTDMAINGGLKLHTEYEFGDSFKGPEGKVYYTAKLVGDPIELTIKLIDKVGFYTRSLRPRWDYISIPRELWDSLSYNQKVTVVKYMYSREGGTKLAECFKSASASEIKINVDDKLKMGDKLS